ncbi:ATPase domain-containing protein [Methanonatronarchaeum sp. AMET6-2]|uniref:ATPase domain-containing protein n=1 Tax=Methanonatronarchaeum sp. AMET6-2 TaxID=2933293 RepID=UPI001FF26F70|nr:ATPase domain-containing protein [Methanonatronarchaeum sp. AMET6-2]UOY10303.1 hypothetical protein MU439_01330 [Methanonatronarchaeum sp. AMET6-2]
MNIQTGSEKIDQLLDGGFRPKSIAQIYGESGSGKTSLALQTAIENIKNGKSSIYIASPNFSIDRFQQICGEQQLEEIASELIVFESKNIEKYKSSLKNLEVIIKKKDIGIVVLDTPTYFLRQKTDGNGYTKKEIAKSLTYLHSLSNYSEFSVIFTNQVYRDIDKDKLVPVGGKMLKDISDKILKIEKIKDNKRRIKIVKNQKNQKKTCQVSITNQGLI